MLNIIDLKIDFLNFSKITNEDYLYLAIPILAYITSNLVYKFLLKNNDKNTSEDTNFNSFQNASIARWAILEGSSFIILFLKPKFILFGVLIIIYLISLRPTEARFKKDVNL